MPKSTCQTSPRSGTPGLLVVEVAEGSSGERGKIVVGQVFGHGNALTNLLTQLDLLARRQALHFIQDLNHRLSHGHKIIKSAASDKRARLFIAFTLRMRTDSLLFVKDDSRPNFARDGPLPKGLRSQTRIAARPSQAVPANSLSRTAARRECISPGPRH